MKKLCLLAISYNEEEHIKFWIDNHRKFVDEVILVDTGSIDNTVKIAKENGIKVFTYKWEHDFSKAKNFALRCCSIECQPDWILFMSPDYWVSNDDMDKIREAIESDSFDAYGSKLMYHHSGWFNTENVTMHGEKETEIGQIVLFRNDPYIYYSWRVHETVDASLSIAGKKFRYLDITRHHDSTNVNKVSRWKYYSALEEVQYKYKYKLSELDSMREKLYKK